MKQAKDDEMPNTIGGGGEDEEIWIFIAISLLCFVALLTFMQCLS